MATLPHWDLTPIFPSPGSRDFAAAQEALSASLTRLVALYDEHGVRGGAPHAPSADEVAAFEAVLDATNALQEAAHVIGGYLSLVSATDAGNEEAARLQSQVQAAMTDASRLSKRFDAWVATLGADSLAAASPLAADHAYALRRSESDATHQMSEDEEGLLADLNLTGGSAWTRFYGDFTSRVTATVAWPDRPAEALPITVVRGLATHPDAQVRQAAYDGEIAAWEAAGPPIASALNAIKGQANTVNRRRGWPDALAPALWANGVERPTLEAMQSAAVASFPDFRRFLRTKAALLGDTALKWCDLLAPVGAAATGPAVGWDEAVAAVSSTFAGYSGPLADLVRRAVEERWIDAEPRGGKRGGAFCMPVQDGVSRVMLNFDGSWDSVQTLAHELGHAYHNTTLRHRTPLQRQTPMALAETASIFCETLMTSAGLASATPERKLTLLNVDLSGACQVVVDIHSRFLFESEVFDRRRSGVLGASELCDLMTEAQEATYGDGISTGHPYMWAVKPHYYSTAFYNWPYTFGLLFGIGLFAAYEADPERFRGGYDDLLSSTGLSNATELAGRFGIDIGSVSFWESSLDVLRGRIDEFVSLAS